MYIQSYKDVVKCVKLHWGIEQQLAVGTATGHVYLFQITSQGTAPKAAGKQVLWLGRDLPVEGRS